MSVSGEVIIDEVKFLHPVPIDAAVDAHRAAFAFNEGQTGITASVHTLTQPETTEFLEYMRDVKEPALDEVLGCYVAPIPAETLSKIKEGNTTGKFVIQQLILKSDGVSTPRRPVDDVLADFNAEMAEVTTRTTIANGSSTRMPNVWTWVRVKRDDGGQEWVKTNYVDAGSEVFTGNKRSASRFGGFLNGLVAWHREQAATPDTQNFVAPQAACYIYTNAA